MAELDKKIAPETVEYLEYIAYEIRKLSLEATSYAGSGHPTSCLSAADILSVLFFNTLNQHDTFILSKGHAAPALYAVYALLGCIKKSDLLTLREFQSPLEGHPTPRFPYTPLATGSLGQGLSMGLGITKINNHKCFVLMGDSEITEGSVWEAIEIAGHYKTHNLVAIIDANGLGQSTKTINKPEDISAKFKSFGWDACITQGNSIPELVNTLSKQEYKKPTCIIAVTIKGYGLPSIQNKDNFHGKVWTKEELPMILKELGLSFKKASVYHKIPEGENALCQKPPSHAYSHISFKVPHFQLQSMASTRKIYGDSLEYLGTLSSIVFVLDAEVNNSTYTHLFSQHFPSRFFQSFITEQNMIGVAAGMASQGVIPFASTFAAFLTRAYDQLRMAAISRLALRIAGSHCGVSIGQDGPSQMGLEDIALFRTLPDSIILYPCDAVSTYRCVELMANHHTSISYLRITRSETPVIYENSTSFRIGGCHIIKKSVHDSITIIAAGVTVFEALSAYKILAQEKICATVIDCYSIKPLPIEEIIRTVTGTYYRAIIVEDHYAAGGLGEAIISNLTEHAPKIPWTITHLAVNKLPMSGTPEELRAYEEIDAQAICKAARKILAGN